MTAPSIADSGTNILDEGNGAPALAAEGLRAGPWHEPDDWREDSREEARGALNTGDVDTLRDIDAMRNVSVRMLHPQTV